METMQMRTTERDFQPSKRESGDQAAPQAPKTPPAAGLNGILETVRQKMAYTIRGI
jgi:hypothetical protein